MKTHYSSLIIAIGVLFLSNSFAQVTFTDGSSNLSNSSLSSGVAIGIADMNGDGLDDLIRLNDASDLEIEYQSVSGTFTMLDYGNVGSGKEWSMCVADVDSNGYNDILAGGSYNNVKLLMANGTGTDYSSTNLPTPLIFLQGSNFADIDNNGTIDIFACHDDGISSVYNNDGAGNYTYDLGLLNAISTVPSDNSGNYGSTWTDYDNDGDLDMYLSKCRLGVTDSMDGRRLNMLFQNDGLGNYTDVAGAAGLLPLAQSWAADFADIDNDGDLDVFIINHDIPSQLLINNGDGTFTDITATSGLVTGLTAIALGIQCKFSDFDNDGFVDLLVTGRSGAHRLFWNNSGNLSFTESDPFATSGNGIQSAAIGDLNNDGNVDVIAGFAIGFNTPSANSDILFFNDGNANNYLNVQLTGLGNATNGIGARLEVYGAWGKQIREIRAGESYGIFNSFMMHFGTGLETNVDSLVVRWPSGIVDVVCNPSINSIVQLTEGTMPTTTSIASFTETTSGFDVSFTNTGSGYSNVIWDFGDGNTSTLQDPTHGYATIGTYTVCLINSNACNTDTTCQSVTISDAGLNENLLQSAILLYPNPSSGIFTLEVRDLSDDAKIQIVDSKGRIIQMFVLSSSVNSRKVDLSSNADGAYVISIASGNRVAKKLFVKQ